jgi:hypothetical protein
MVVEPAGAGLRLTLEPAPHVRGQARSLRSFLHRRDGDDLGAVLLRHLASGLDRDREQLTFDDLRVLVLDVGAGEVVDLAVGRDDRQRIALLTQVMLQPP